MYTSIFLLPPPHAVPAEPTITDLTASSTALTVTWTNTDTSIEVDDYEVAVLDTNRLVNDTRVGSSVTTASLDVTDKGVTYTVTVTAVNKVGPSSPASRMLYFAGMCPSQYCLYIVYRYQQLLCLHFVISVLQSRESPKMFLL